MKFTVIDNRDSFTFNLVDALAVAGAEMQVLRNSISAEKALESANGGALLLGPGPGDPASAGCCLDLCVKARGIVPLIGICLGHQAIVEAAGGRVRRAAAPAHAETARLAHRGDGVLAGLPDPLIVGRYHSLCTPVSDLPARFAVDAEHGGMAMAVRDEAGLQLGLQFHPESILTPRGDRLVANMLAWAKACLDRPAKAA
ncbi:anthranilate synthase component II [Sphingomicrobium aestuariivivum]|uniref:anthranilate synthase component II n=1 Tax=Sphingomicrobium aestuariivivum TaxID=1582356 RepID=UPI001FD70EB9|nr:gamma-glutamyl-gamma-aminobutyrate hydrolase family protein [Sphingomicrobium aestuariivivum]MCJ8191132.1 gamma-glutamyl-gamma-aminobutyrate hydrolase family protein [Sphingomicrobium aestuariivivum]